MLSIITSYLLQTGKCALPYIGFFNTRHKASVNDMVNAQVLPPAENIVFSEEATGISGELVQYVAFKKNIPENAAAIELDEFFREWKVKLEAGGKLCFETFGCLQNDASGQIIFLPENSYAYRKPVAAHRVTLRDPEHAAQEADETTSGVMDKYSNQEVVAEKSWHARALVLFVVGLVMLLYSFYSYKLSPSSVGNRAGFTIKAAGETHTELSK